MYPLREIRIFTLKNTLYFPLTKRMSRSFERRWAKEAARTFLEWVLLGSMFMLHTVECFNFSGGWQFKHKAGLNLGTLYNKLLRIARNLLETRENIKIESRSFYHIICGWFSWGSSKKNPKWPIFKIAVFQNCQFSKIFCENFMDWSFGY